ncbi:SRPBCC domain-containing protein [Paenisporosarcina cavernae]|uniref:SRPBCC domain-containing protein n=1 Tax=Paenisporosarcina cavernae TaxID=2320858 RepID=UPI0013C403EF|nr:SRPBCC domain-containing protein [Paenisporosarcina cavernae]
MRTFHYDIYIAASPDKIWEAWTKSEHTERYFFGTAIRSDWNIGSSIEYLRGEVTDFGEIIELIPNRKLVHSWSNTSDTSDREEPTVVSLTLTSMGDVTKVTLDHEKLLSADYEENPYTFRGYNNGWPFILSNLKSYIETDNLLEVDFSEDVS